MRAVGVGRRHRGHRRGVLGDVDRGGGAAAVGGDDRGIVVDVGDGDRDRLRVGEAAVGGLTTSRRRRCCRRRRSGASKSGAETKVSAPVVALMVNACVGAADDPVGQRCAPSASVASTVVTAVVFSATLTEALAPPPLEVMTGAFVDVGDGDGDRLGVGRCRRTPDRHVVDVVRRRHRSAPRSSARRRRSAPRWWRRS